MRTKGSFRLSYLEEAFGQDYESYDEQEDYSDEQDDCQIEENSAHQFKEEFRQGSMTDFH